MLLMKGLTKKERDFLKKLLEIVFVTFLLIFFFFIDFFFFFFKVSASNGDWCIVPVSFREKMKKDIIWAISEGEKHILDDVALFFFFFFFLIFFVINKNIE
jgi:hypothetical protein